MGAPPPPSQKRGFFGSMSEAKQAKRSPGADGGDRKSVEPRVARSQTEVASRSPVGRQVASRSRQQVASGRQWSPVGCQQKSPVPQLVRWRPPVASWSPGRQQVASRSPGRQPVENHIITPVRKHTPQPKSGTCSHITTLDVFYNLLGLDVFYLLPHQSSHGVNIDREHKSSRSNTTKPFVYSNIDVA